MTPAATGAEGGTPPPVQAQETTSLGVRSSFEFDRNRCGVACLQNNQFGGHSWPIWESREGRYFFGDDSAGFGAAGEGGAADAVLSFAIIACSSALSLGSTCDRVSSTTFCVSACCAPPESW